MVCFIYRHAVSSFEQNRMATSGALAVLYRLLEPGARIHPLELPFMYVLPIAWFLSLDGEWGQAITSLFTFNAACQLGLVSDWTNYSCLSLLPRPSKQLHSRSP